MTGIIIILLICLLFWFLRGLTMEFYPPEQPYKPLSLMSDMPDELYNTTGFIYFDEKQKKWETDIKN